MNTHSLHLHATFVSALNICHYNGQVVHVLFLDEYTVYTISTFMLELLVRIV